MVTVPDSSHAAEGSSLVVRGVTKVFRAADGGSVHVLDRLSLTVEAGEMVSLVGPSGCGKSTLLRLIAGLDVPTEGELLVGTTPITGPSAERGLVFQDPNLFPWLTVRGNIQAGLVAPRRAGQAEARGGRFHGPGRPGTFRRRLPAPTVRRHGATGGPARALINHPKVLLLDEPLGSLDAFTRMRMQDEVLRLWEARGTTMLLVTHDIDEAIYMSDRIVLMTPRPGAVERVIDVPLARPRRPQQPGFLAAAGGDPGEAALRRPCRRRK